MSEKMDILKRLSLIEKVLGIESMGHCKGGPEHCGDCDPEKCPLTNNLLHSMAFAVGDLQEQVRVTEIWLEELERAGISPPQVRHLTAMRIQKRLLQYQITQITKLESMEGKLPSILNACLQDKLSRLSFLESRISEMENGG